MVRIARRLLLAGNARLVADELQVFGAEYLRSPVHFALHDSQMTEFCQVFAIGTLNSLPHPTHLRIFVISVSCGSVSGNSLASFCRMTLASAPLAEISISALASAICFGFALSSNSYLSPCSQVSWIYRPGATISILPYRHESPNSLIVGKNLHALRHLRMPCCQRSFGISLSSCQ